MSSERESDELWYEAVARAGLEPRRSLSSARDPSCYARDAGPLSNEVEEVLEEVLEGFGGWEFRTASTEDVIRELAAKRQRNAGQPWSTLSPQPCDDMDQDIVRLRVVEGLSTREVARALGRSEAECRSRLAWVMSRLAQSKQEDS